jgi:uncharacterized membrane protein
VANEDLIAQFAAIIKEFAAFRVEAAGAKGAFKATGKIGGVVIALLILMGGYAFNKLENQGKEIALIKQEVAIIKVEFKSKVVVDKEWKRSVDERLEKVLYRED